MTRVTLETFFLPDEVNRRPWTIQAPLYNLYRSLLIRNNNEPVFVPIRSMQFLAILDQREIHFVDSQSYAISGDNGGRRIVITWDFSPASDRDSLNKPVPCVVVFFAWQIDDIQQRLVVEFKRAMELQDRRYRDR